MTKTLHQRMITIREKNIRKSKEILLGKLEIAKQILINEFHPKKIILYGSLADGNHVHPFSDIDLAVDGLGDNYLKAGGRLIDALGECIDLKPLEMLEKEFKDYVLNHGKMIYSSNASINSIFKKYAVSIAYLFGSQMDAGRRYIEGKGIEVEKDSDLDIGVVFINPPEDVYNVYGNLYADLSNIFKPFKIDIVFMHEASFIFRFEIIKGHRIYALNADDADEFEEMVIRYASDLSFKRKMFEPDFYEALRDGYFEIELK
ncbi:MAG: nucleotidyltransferase domain-containing protein [Nitrospirae bacterium]|nr:nucleotidyltransferase domain-containing protein [Nitrospirota bacterium]